MFVGYSHNDTVMNYLSRALPAQEPQKRFALTDDPDVDRWKVLGIDPILYPKNPDGDHVGLGEGIRGLADHARRSLRDWRHEISKIAGRPPSLNKEELDIVEEALSDPTTAQFFADAATDPEWLDWLDRCGHLDPLFGASDLPDVHGPIADWMVDRFAFDHPGTVFRLIGQHGMSLNPLVWRRLADAIVFRDRPALNGELLSRWVPCLLATAPPGPDRWDILDLAQHCAKAGAVDSLVEIFDAIGAHRLYLRPAFPDFEEEITGVVALPGDDIQVELGPDGDGGAFRELWETHLRMTVKVPPLIGGAFRELWETHLRPQLGSVADPVLSIAVAHLDARHRTLLGWQKADGDWDPESCSRHAIEPHKQDHGFHHVDVLIDAARDCLEWLAGNQPEAAAAWRDRLVRSRTPLLRRLAVHALSVGEDLSACQKLDWVFENADLHDDAAHHETVRLMRELYPQADTERRARVIDLIRDFTWPETSSDDEEERRTRLAARYRFDWLRSLHDGDPDCGLVKQALDDILNRYPQFTNQSRGSPDHSWSVDRLLSRPAREWLDDLLSSSPEFDADVHDAVSAAADAAERDFRWGSELAAVLADRDLWESDLWIGLLRAWRGAALDDTQLSKVFGYLREPHLSKVRTRRIADILVARIERADIPMSGEMLMLANEVAVRLWNMIDREEPPGACDSWHALAVGGPAGVLTRYWLQQHFLLRNRPDLLPDTLLASVSAAFSMIVRDSSVAGLQGKSVLAGHLAFLLDTEEVWTREHLVPRFAQQPDTCEWRAVWDGFLARGRLTPVVGECLKDAFLKVVPHVVARFPRGWKLDRFVYFWVLMVAHFADDPLGTWIPAFFNHAEGAARIRFASEIGRHLQHMDDAQQREWWDHWLESYWSRRLDGVPRPLCEREIESMIGWLPSLKSLFSEGIKLALIGSSVPIHNNHIIADLWRGDHVGKSPEAIAKLMIHLGKHASRGPEWYRSREVIDALLGNEHLPVDLQGPLRELAAKLGHPEGWPVHIVENPGTLVQPHVDQVVDS